MDTLFISLGLDAKEKQIYLKLLSIGASSVSALAKKIGMPRSSLYVVIEKLKAMEVIDVFQNSGKTFVRAAEASALKELLEKKSRRLRNALVELEENANLFEEAQKKRAVMPKVNIYEGAARIKKIYKTWETAANYRCFYDCSRAEKEEFTQRIKTKSLNLKGKDVYAKEIWFDSELAREYKKLIKNPAFEVKLLPAKAKLNADVMIFEDRIHLNSDKDEKSLEVVELINKELADYMIIFFDELWNRL